MLVSLLGAASLALGFYLLKELRAAKDHDLGRMSAGREFPHRISLDRLRELGL